MFKLTIKLPCLNVNDRDKNADLIKMAGGVIQEEKVNFKLKEQTLYITVEPDVRKKFEIYLTDPDCNATILSGSRGI